MEDIIWSPIDSASPLQNNYFFYEAIREDRFKWLFLKCLSLWPTGIWEWQPLRVGLKLSNRNLSYFSLFGSLRHIISARAVSPIGIQSFFFLLLSLIASALQTDSSLPDQAILQVEELALIQILCKWFVPFLSFCSCLIELCCFVSTVTMAPLFLHSYFLFEFVSCLSQHTGENVPDHQSLDYNAAA